MKRFLRFLYHLTFGLLCVIGVGVTFVGKWSSTMAWEEETLKLGKVDMHQAYLTPLQGTDTWHGIATATIFLVLLLFRVATGARKPAPIWRPMITLVAGAAVLVILLIYGNFKYWDLPPAIAAFAAIGLLFLGCVELRGNLHTSR